jgi:hypothetical protein
VSNFGNRNPTLKKFLKQLKARGVVDDIIEYKPVAFTPSQKKELTSPRATGMDLGKVQVPAQESHCGAYCCWFCQGVRVPLKFPINFSMNC